MHSFLCEWGARSQRSQGRSTVFLRWWLFTLNQIREFLEYGFAHNQNIIYLFHLGQVLTFGDTGFGDYFDVDLMQI